MVRRVYYTKAPKYYAEQTYYTTTTAAPVYYTKAPKYYAEPTYYTTTTAAPVYYTEAPKYDAEPTYYTPPERGGESIRGNVFSPSAAQPTVRATQPPVPLRCLAPEGIPPPDVNWQKNGVTVEQLDRQVMYLLFFTNNSNLQNAHFSFFSCLRDRFYIHIHCPNGTSITSQHHYTVHYMYLLLFTNNWQRVLFLVKGGEVD
jgi:hypothetical protein